MVALIIILCIAAILALLLLTKVTLRIRYKESLCIDLKILFIKLRIYPSKKKPKRYKHSMSKRKAKKIRDSLKKKPKKERKIFKKKKKKKDEEKDKEEKLDKNDILSIISIIINFVKNFIRLFSKSIRLKASRIHLTVATDNAASTALTYAAVTESINVLFPLLDGIKAVKKLPHGKDLSVNVDFIAEEPTIDIEIELYIRVIRALGSVLGASIKAFKKAVKDQIKRLERKR